MRGQMFPKSNSEYYSTFFKTVSTDRVPWPLDGLLWLLFPIVSDINCYIILTMDYFREYFRLHLYDDELFALRGILPMEVTQAPEENQPVPCQGSAVVPQLWVAHGYGGERL